jgi:Serine carboxypeptidase
MNLKGILVGNACTNPRECYEPSMNGEDGMSIYQYEFLHAHAYMTDDDYMRITGACTLGYRSPECIRLRGIADKKFDQTLTVINNIYQPCYHQVIPDSPIPKALQGRKSSRRTFTTCEDLIGIMHFFNSPNMQSNLHVDFTKYDICNDEVADRYVMLPEAS